MKLEELAAERGVGHRDCRSCTHLEDQGDGLAYGWCRAHTQFVKWYHPPGQFWSQCQFKALGRDRRVPEQDQEPEGDEPAAATGGTGRERSSL